MFSQVNNQSGFRTLILLLLISGAAALLISPAFAGTGVTISADGSQSYYLGEKVVLRGLSPDADTVYLFMTGPNLPAAGGKLTSPEKAVVSGNPDSFTAVKTKPDKTWEYSFYTANLRLDAGSYTLYAASEPKAVDQLGPGATHIWMILKKPFITTEISPSNVVKGKPFLVTGTAEGRPAEVQIWILGETYRVIAKEPVSVNATYEYRASPEILANLPTGSYYLIAQHSMTDNQFDVVVSGDNVRNLKLNNGTNVFSLQDSNVADALIATINDQEANKDKSARDTYSIVPFQITDAGSASAVPVSGASADTGITISADGDHSYYLGEKVVLRGQSPDADTVYLFMTGPKEVLPAMGVKLTSSDKAVVSGNPDSFTVVKTKPDKTWEYSFYTANFINPNTVAGTYTIYAVNQPKAMDQLGPGAANVGMALKKPFITAKISSSEVVKGQPFTVTGIAEGIPPEAQIWIIGDANTYTTKTPVNSDASFTFNGDATISGKLPKGQNYLIVQHPMADNQFDFVVSGDYVRNLKLNNGTNVFKITGPGSLRGSDAAEALIAAINKQEANDTTYTNDMYTIVPFKVTDA